MDFAMLFFLHDTPPDVPIGKYRNSIGRRVGLSSTLLYDVPNIIKKPVGRYLARLQSILFHTLNFESIYQFISFAFPPIFHFCNSSHSQQTFPVLTGFEKQMRLRHYGLFAFSRYFYKDNALFLIE